MSVKDNVTNIDTWLRGLFILVFGVIFYVLYGVIWLLVVLQFLTQLLTGKLNENLSGFSTNLTNFAFQILLYITFQSEERPFPFSPWPDKNADHKTSLPGSGEADSEQITEIKNPDDEDSQ